MGNNGEQEIVFNVLLFRTSRGSHKCQLKDIQFLKLNNCGMLMVDLIVSFQIVSSTL